MRKDKIVIIFFLNEILKIPGLSMIFAAAIMKIKKISPKYACLHVAQDAFLHGDVMRRAQHEENFCSQFFFRF